MISFNSNGDSRGRKNLTIDQSSDDRTQRCNLSLSARNFPTEFENSNSRNHQIDVNIISMDDYSPSDNPNSFLIPLVLSSVARIDDKTTFSYRNKFDDLDNTPVFCRVDMSIESDSDSLIEQPALLIKLSVKSDQELKGEGQTLSGGQTTAYIHTDRGENAPGGLSIPADKFDGPMQSNDRFHPASEPERVLS